MRFFIFSILLFSLLMPTFAAGTPESTHKALIEKLNNSASDSSKLQTLYDLIKITMPQPSEQITYIDMLLEEAENQKNNKFLCMAYWSLIVRSYNDYDYENALKWQQKLEPLALQEHLYDLLFQGKIAMIEMLSINEEYEKQEYEAKKMYQEALALDNQLGMILAKQSLANVCIETFRYKEAAQILEEALEIHSNAATRCEILFVIISAYKNLNDIPNLYKYVTEYNKMMDTYMKEYPTKLDVLMQNYAFLTDYYIRTDNKPMASRYIDSVQKYYSPQYADMLTTTYHECCYSYYDYVHEYEKAIEHVDHAINLTANTFSQNYFTKVLVKKAELLRKNNQKIEAVKWYKIGIAKVDSIRLVKITKQEEYLKDKFDAHNHQLESQRISNYQNRVIIIAAFLILAGLICFIHYTIKIRRQLKKDEAEMRRMTNDMEIANKAKDNFLNNISNSISVPLNYIVLNSQRLGSDNQLNADEKMELSTSLRINSSKLMAMINDILDFSRIEAGMMKLSKDETNIIHLINDTLTEEGRNKKINISWHLSASGNNYITIVDMSRFQTLIRSLLQVIDERLTISVSITNDDDSNQLTVVIQNPLLSMKNPTQDVIIRNEINKTIVQQFNGVYQINTESNTITMVIGYSLGA